MCHGRLDCLLFSFPLPHVHVSLFTTCIFFVTYRYLSQEVISSVDMPSFSFLKRNRLSSEGQQSGDAPADNAGDAIVDKTTADEKIQARRRQSKRDFFRTLLSGNNPRSESEASDRGRAKVCHCLPLSFQQNSSSHPPLP